MVQPKYSPEEALQRIKLMMEYNTSKTLDENKQMISEQSLSDVVKQTTAGAAVGAGAAALGTIWGGGFAAPVGAVVGGVYGLTRALLGGNVSRGKIKELLQGCSNKKELGKPTLSTGELDSIGDSINTSLRDLGTDEESIKASFTKIPTIPDLCAVVDNYNEFHGNLVTDLDDDLEGDEEWRDYVYLPLRNAIRTSIELTDKIKKDGGKTGGKSGKGKGKVGSTYKLCKGTYTYGCKTDPSGPIGVVQGCLNLTSDGKFGPKTASVLKQKGITTFTDDDVTKICSKTKIENPKDEFSTQVDADSIDDILNN